MLPLSVSAREREVMVRLVEVMVRLVVVLIVLGPLMTRVELTVMVDRLKSW